MKTMRWCDKTIAGLCGLLLLAGMSNGARAGVCSYNGGATEEASYVFSVPARITLTGSEQPGQVLWTSPPAGGDKAVYASCPGRAGSAGLIDNYGHTRTSRAGNYYVYPTNVAGVGVSIGYTTFSSGLQGYPNNPDGVTPGNNDNSLTATLRFIKTSDAYFSGTRATTNMSGEFATWYVGTNKLRFATFMIPNTTTFIIPGGGGGATTCMAEPVAVLLGSVTVDTLQSAAPVQVNVRVTCNGVPRSLNNITLRPHSTIVGSSCDGTMRNRSDGAQGVGIQMMDENSGNLVCWNQADPNDYAQYFSRSQKTLVFGYTAKMVQTGRVSPGRVTGAATMSFDYN